LIWRFESGFIFGQGSFQKKKEKREREEGQEFWNMLYLIAVVCFMHSVMSAEAHGGHMQMSDPGAPYIMPHTSSLIHGLFMLAVSAFLIPTIAASAGAKSKNHRYIAMGTLGVATLGVLLMIPFHGLGLDHFHGVVGWLFLGIMWAQAVFGFTASAVKNSRYSSGESFYGIRVSRIPKIHRVSGKVIMFLGVAVGWIGACKLMGVFDLGPIPRNEFIGHSLTSIAFFVLGYFTFTLGENPDRRMTLEGWLFIVGGIVYITMDFVTTVDWNGRFKAMSFQQHVSLACLWIAAGCLNHVLVRVRVNSHDASFALALFAHVCAMASHPQETDLGKYLHMLHGASLAVGVLLRFAKQWESAALFFWVSAVALLCGQAGVVDFGIRVGMDATAFIVSVLCALVTLTAFHMYLWKVAYPTPEEYDYEPVITPNTSSEEESNKERPQVKTLVTV